MYWTTGLYNVTINGVPSFQAANPGAGIPQGTQFTAGWFNDVQGELLAFPDKAGIAPAPNTPNQAVTASIVMFTPATLYFVASTTVAVPAWATRVRFKLIAGGGSGGVYTSSTGRGGGGGAGGMCVGEGPIGPGSEMTITIGAGGGGVTSGGGQSGGLTTIGGLATATGGGGGGGSPPSGGTSGDGAISGTATGSVEGLGSGGDGNPSAYQPGGDGGGAGGRGSTTNGVNAVGHGGGGGGCPGGSESGAGMGGYVELEFLP